MNLFKRNMELLKQKNSSLYNKALNYHKSKKVVIDKEFNEGNAIAQIKDIANGLTVNIEKTRQTGYTISVKNDEQKMYLHSSYNPCKESKKLVKNFKDQNASQIIALGFGLGYHLLELIDSNESGKVFIIEPHLIIFYAALLYNDLTPLLKSNKLFLIIGTKKDIYPIISRNFEFCLREEVVFFEHSSSIRLFNDVYNKIYKEIKNGINFKLIHIATDINSSKQWRDNIILNLPYILETPKADDFFGKFKETPAICVSAGPSLDKNIDQLKKVKGKALVMCVGTALKALLKEGVKPDIVVTIDGGKVNYKRHFKELINLQNVFLFSEKGNYHQINEHWVGPQVFFTMKRNLSGWVEGMKGEYTSINTGGTVAHSMVDLAYRFGCNPIVLVGQDLAYDNKRTHASGTGHEGRPVNKGKRSFLVEGINGNKVYTSKDFKTFLDYFNNYFSHKNDRLYIDATEGGAKINHTKIMSLKEVIDEYCIKNNACSEELKETYELKKAGSNIDKSFEVEINSTIGELKRAIKTLENELLVEVNVAEKKLLSNRDLSDNEVIKIEKKLSKYHRKVLEYKRTKYFTQRTLIIEQLKYEEVNNKEYDNVIQELQEKVKYYKKYWKGYLQQLKESVKLLHVIEPKILDCNGG